VVLHDYALYKSTFTLLYFTFAAGWFRPACDQAFDQVCNWLEWWNAVICPQDSSRTCWWMSAKLCRREL